MGQEGRDPLEVSVLLINWNSMMWLNPLINMYKSPTKQTVKTIKMSKSFKFIYYKTLIFQWNLRLLNISPRYLKKTKNKKGFSCKWRNRRHFRFGPVPMGSFPRLPLLATVNMSTLAFRKDRKSIRTRTPWTELDTYRHGGSWTNSLNQQPRCPRAPFGTALGQLLGTWKAPGFRTPAFPGVDQC